MPGTGEPPGARLARGLDLLGTPGQFYVERRAIPVNVAREAGVLFDPDWGGRPAVIVAMRDSNETLCSVHGRYLEHTGKQNKMLTVGPGGGVVSVLGGWHKDPMVLVEGLFDALSLATCGFSSVATVGRWSPGLPDICAGRAVWLAFDGNRPGEEEAALYRERLSRAITRRIVPPDRSKDWNTALMKKGRATVQEWINVHLTKES